MYAQLKKIDPKIQKNILFKNLTTFEVGGPARYFSLINDEPRLIKLLKFARKNKLKFLIIGEGSNLLVSDAGFDGLTIKLNFCSAVVKKNIIAASADMLLNQLVGLSVSRGLTGLEFATGIPGTVGGAVVGNAGAYGFQIADVLEKVEVLNKDFKKLTLDKKSLSFDYRYSSLMGKEQIVLKVFLKLKRGNQDQSIKKMIGLGHDRWQKHPHQPSAGSTFKNIILTKAVVKNLTDRGYKIPEKFFEYKKIATAWLIEQLGLKGQKIGQAQISEKHANHIVNCGNATADEVVQLISFVKTKARDQLGIQLEEEVRYVGF